MIDVLILRFDAPLMSFGAPIVDQQGEINPYPALSMMTGLLGNALGFDHSEFDRLDRLQARLRYASRQDRKGRQIQDYQTVDLSKPYMDDDRAWTTRDELEKRKGGSASSGTHIRYRDYWADAVHTVAVTLDRSDEKPTLDDLERAVKQPERPLFLGRKPCLPAGSLFAGRRRTESLPGALVRAPLADRHDDKKRHPAWWPTHPDDPRPQDENPDGPIVEDMRQPITDRRDWENQIHTGERWLAEGTIRVTSDNDV
jgi:CRISPR system Cascade subunit CasD